MAKGWALSTGNLPQGGLPRNSVDRKTDRPDMTSAVDSGRKILTQQQLNNRNISLVFKITLLSRDDFVDARADPSVF